MQKAFMVVAVVAVLAAAGAGYLAWRSAEQLDSAQSRLNAAETSTAKVRAELRQATQDLATAAKDVKELKLATDRLTVERDQVRAALEKNQADGVNLRAELALAREQVSYLSARTSKDVVRGMPRTASAVK